VEILAILGLLCLALAISIGSVIRTYFARSRLRGIQEATFEIVRGINSHYEADGQSMPASVAKAVEAIKAITKRSNNYKKIDRYYALLWIFGDAIGGACWKKGYEAGKRKAAPKEGKIFVELSLNELMQLTWLAHLGFKNMMPNHRGLEIHRFSGKDDAEEGARAVERLEVAVPEAHRPFDDPLTQSKTRLALIGDWWSSERKLLKVV
jgi:hypothetical protein